MLEIDTPHGPARAHLHAADAPAGALVLGHGAGGGVTARDLAAATEAALAAGVSVALVEQPYRVAGRRAPPPRPPHDAGRCAGGGQHRAGGRRDQPRVAGGRSSGARVACRTAAATGAAGVLCLAFPVHPPGRPEKTRLPELDAVAVPTLVVQGASDPFGMPPPGPHRRVVTVPGNHSLTGDLEAVRSAVGAWLAGVLRLPD